MRKDSVLAYIKEYAKTQPDTLAVCELRKTVTYEQYFMNIRKMAAVLMSAGIQKDEHVILKCTQNINYLTIFTALQYMGALPIPVEKATMPERMTEIGAQVEAKTLISDAEAEGMRFFSAKELEKQMAEAEPADCGLPKAQSRSMILFTTGTTGKSKGVVVRHINDVAVAENVIGGTHMRSRQCRDHSDAAQSRLRSQKISVRYGKRRNSLPDGWYGICRNPLEADGKISGKLHGTFPGFTWYDLQVVR